MLKGQLAAFGLGELQQRAHNPGETVDILQRGVNRILILLRSLGRH